jgi:hypothetical protein
MQPSAETTVVPPPYQLQHRPRRGAAPVRDEEDIDGDRHSTNFKSNDCLTMSITTPTSTSTSTVTMTTTVDSLLHPSERGARRVAVSVLRRRRRRRCPPTTANTSLRTLMFISYLQLLSDDSEGRQLPRGNRSRGPNRARGRRRTCCCSWYLDLETKRTWKSAFFSFASTVSAVSPRRSSSNFGRSWSVSIVTSPPSSPPSDRERAPWTPRRSTPSGVRLGRIRLNKTGRLCLPACSFSSAYRKSPAAGSTETSHRTSTLPRVDPDEINVAHRNHFHDPQRRFERLPAPPRSLPQANRQVPTSNRVDDRTTPRGASLHGLALSIAPSSMRFEVAKRPSSPANGRRPLRWRRTCWPW